MQSLAWPRGERRSGTTLEVRRRAAESRLVDIAGGGPFNPSHACQTADAAMAPAVADSLLASGHLDWRDLNRPILVAVAAWRILVQRALP